MMVNSLLMMIWNWRLNLNEKVMKKSYLLRMTRMRNKKMRKNLLQNMMMDCKKDCLNSLMTLTDCNLSFH